MEMNIREDKGDEWEVLCRLWRMASFSNVLHVMAVTVHGIVSGMVFFLFLKKLDTFYSVSIFAMLDVRV